MTVLRTRRRRAARSRADVAVLAVAVVVLVAAAGFEHLAGLAGLFAAALAAGLIAGFLAGRASRPAGPLEAGEAAVMPDVYTDPATRDPQAAHSPWAVLRGLAGVAALFAGAADALVTAWLGIPRLAWLARRVATEALSAYQRRAQGVVDTEWAEIIDDPGAGPGAERQEGGTDDSRTPADTGA